MISVLFSARGKISRGEFFYHFTLLCFCIFILKMITVYFGVSKLYFWCLVPVFAWSLSVLQIKRFRDRSRSGWRYVVFLILALPYITALFYSALLTVYLAGQEMGGFAGLLANYAAVYFVTPAIAQHFVEMFILPGQQEDVADAFAPQVSYQSV